LKFPFAVVGGVLVVPTYEETGTVEAKQAEVIEEEVAEKELPLSDELKPVPSGTGTQKSTRHLIERAVQRLERAGGRKSEADGAHLLEGIAVVAYDPNIGRIDPDLPPKGSGLRWDEFVEALTKAYEARFET
jgi:hypothetical protein